jgi:hypothetical protein
MILALATSLLLAAAPATVTVELKPAKSVLKVDGKKKGTGEKPMTLKLPSGKHVFRVEYKGDAHEEEVVLKPGPNKWSWEFTGVEEEPAPEKAPEKAP